MAGEAGKLGAAEIVVGLVRTRKRTLFKPQPAQQNIKTHIFNLEAIFDALVFTILCIPMPRLAPDRVSFPSHSSTHEKIPSKAQSSKIMPLVIKYFDRFFPLPLISSITFHRKPQNTDAEKR